MSGHRLTSLLTSPQQGVDAAVPVARPTTGAACTDTGEAGPRHPASPVPHRLTAQVAHTHSSRDERLACEAEHATVMARLARA